MNSFMAFRRGIEFFHDAQFFLLPQARWGGQPSASAKVCDDPVGLLRFSLRL